MNLPSDLEEFFMKSVTKVIQERFNVDGVTDIKVLSIELDKDEQKIRIEFSITTSEKPEQIAENYFGLTGKVRDALGAQWSGFFPVMTPQINTEIHA